MNDVRFLKKLFAPGGIGEFKIPRGAGTRYPIYGIVIVPCSNYLFKPA